MKIKPKSTGVIVGELLAISQRFGVGYIAKSRMTEVIEKINNIQRHKCGDANPNGNVALFRKGACKKKVTLEEGYRCTGCDSLFHKDCIINHFKQEESHDWGRHEERQQIKNELIESIEKDNAGMQFRTIDDDYKACVKGYKKAQSNFITHIKEKK